MKKLIQKDVTKDELMRLPAGTLVRARDGKEYSGLNTDVVAEGPFFVYRLQSGRYVAVAKLDVFTKEEVLPSPELLAQHGELEIPPEWKFIECKGIMVGRCHGRTEEEGGGVRGLHWHRDGWICVQSPKTVWGQTRTAEGDFVPSGKPSRKLQAEYNQMVSWLSRRGRR